MTAVIRYKTLYILSYKGNFILFFTLDNDISLRSVLGLPTLLVMGAIFDLFSVLLSCVELNRNFSLELHPLVKVYPMALF